MKFVSTAFLASDDDILLLKRPKDAPTYPSMWSAVSGFMEKGETPIEAAIREVKEETGIAVDERNLAGVGVPFDVDSFRVHPHLFRTKRRDVTLCSENVEYRWVNPEEIKTLNTVSRLYEALVSTDYFSTVTE